MTKKARYIMIGGFLGAGKTTLLRRLGRWLADKGVRVGLITNDQAGGLVDTALTKADELPTEEIAGGCFCCRFHSLIDAAAKLTRENRPDVFLAEPVGSCTDLVATVALPLQHLYGEEFEIAPFSVLVDPIRAERVLGLAEGRRFSDNVLYIYRKQLEEAQQIVLNKIDLLPPDRLDALEAALRSEFPRAAVHRLSARSGDGAQEWFDGVLRETLSVSEIMDVDYPRYGEGEALLGWLNAAVTLHGEEWDGNAFLLRLAGDLQRQLAASGQEVAHLKMILSRAEDAYDLAAGNLVRGDAAPELSHRLADPLDEAALLINCRAEASPEFLRDAVESALAKQCAETGLRFTVTQFDHFRPGMPKPTHRMAAAASAS